MLEVFYKQCGKYKVYSIRDNGDIHRPDFLIYINNGWKWVGGTFCVPVEADINKRLTREEYTEKYCKGCTSLCPGVGSEWFSGCRHAEELEQ